MTLRELMSGAGTVELGTRAAELEVSGLAYDNRAVTPGSLFFCVPGLRRDGHDFAPDAVARGAVALVVERPLGSGVPELLVGSARSAMAQAAARFYGDPSRQLAVIGVTGTNGKTTTTFLLRALLEEDGRPCGLLGTVKRVIGGRSEPVERTTPEAIDLQRDLRAMLDAGDRACAMEVSSHALALSRVEGVRFAAAIFTNLTQDHLDFHPTMEDYFQAKRRLLVEGGGARVVNVDDAYGRRLAAELGDAITFAVERPADFTAHDVRIAPGGSRFTISMPDGQIAARSPLPGSFNVANVLGAVAAARALGISAATIELALPGAGRVPGRFERVDEGQDFTVLVDYAHTPDSLSNALVTARELTSRRLICVFGCGGDRDRAKRPLMGEIATRLADAVIVTSDNPRSEDPAAIIAEILAGAGSGAQREPDRRLAIERAIAVARAGDIVVIAGKGHEQGQELAGGRKLPFDDVTVARAALRAQLAGSGR